MTIIKRNNVIMEKWETIDRQTNRMRIVASALLNAKEKEKGTSEFQKTNNNNNNNNNIMNNREVVSTLLSLRTTNPPCI